MQKPETPAARTACALLAAAALAGCGGCTPWGYAPPQAQPEPAAAEPAAANGAQKRYSVNGRQYEVKPRRVGYSQRGYASWYGKKFHGRQTANGEVFNMYKPSAAHKTLPLPSYVKVTNLKNGRNIVVRVNDRGPFHGNRIIDLSYAAARTLGMVEAGVAPVEIELLKAPDDWRGVYVQVAAYNNKGYARKLVDKLKARNLKAFVGKPGEPNPAVPHRVRIGPLRHAAELERVKTVLHNAGYRGYIVVQ